MNEDPQIAALRAALGADPGNGALHAVLGDLLAAAGRSEDARASYRHAESAGMLSEAQRVAAANLAIDAGDLGAAGRLIDAAPTASPGLAAVRARLGDILRRADEASRPGPGELAQLRQTSEADIEPRPRPARASVRFDEVAGHDEVKAAISKAIILPFTRPDLYASYGRRAGAGVLLYGPPGCGKTLLARATAGECGVPFQQIRVEDVLSPWRGESERSLHEAFAAARESAPCVLFLDEIDAIAFSRSRHAGQEGRALVTVLLQELDGMESANDGILVLAASNTPWDIDDALLRPGRFDRQLFVPPPDEKARHFLLSALLARRPNAAGDLTKLAEGTPLFSGADLTHLIELAVDQAIDESLASGGTVPVSAAHLAQAKTKVRPTTADWLLSARNYAEFANTAGRYDEVRTYLGRREVKRALSS